MTNKKISQLALKNSLASADVIPILDSADSYSNKKILGSSISSNVIIDNNSTTPTLDIVGNTVYIFEQPLDSLTINSITIPDVDKPSEIRFKISETGATTNPDHNASEFKVALYDSLYNLYNQENIPIYIDDFLIAELQGGGGYNDSEYSVYSLTFKKSCNDIITMSGEAFLFIDEGIL